MRGIKKQIKRLAIQKAVGGSEPRGSERRGGARGRGDIFDYLPFFFRLAKR